MGLRSREQSLSPNSKTQPAKTQPISALSQLAKAQPTSAPSLPPMILASAKISACHETLPSQALQRVVEQRWPGCPPPPPQPPPQPARPPGWVQLTRNDAEGGEEGERAGRGASGGQHCKGGGVTGKAHGHGSRGQVQPQPMEPPHPKLTRPPSTHTPAQRRAAQPAAFGSMAAGRQTSRCCPTQCTTASQVAIHPPCRAVRCTAAGRPANYPRALPPHAMHSS